MQCIFLKEVISNNTVNVKTNSEVHVKHLKVHVLVNCVCTIPLNYEIYFLKFPWKIASGVF